MYTHKKHILLLAALLKAHGIGQVVLCPGSRNIAIIKTLSKIDGIQCHAVTDERSAAFYALGLALQTRKPVAVCCTSGTALLNFHPAVAEAFYQNVPLLILSADRPARWIGQMDGQTLPQPDVFKDLVKTSVNLPEISNVSDEAYCARLLHEALLALTHHTPGPVHINIPVSEPFFDTPVTSLPAVRPVVRLWGAELDKSLPRLANTLKQSCSRMAVVGQCPFPLSFDDSVHQNLGTGIVWLGEHLSNSRAPGCVCKQFDRLISACDPATRSQLMPELLITYGGHIVSKALKLALRKHPPQYHWHICPEGKVIDLFGALTHVIEATPEVFFKKLAALGCVIPANAFVNTWQRCIQQLPQQTISWSSLSAVGEAITQIPVGSVLHLANSSVIRYAQLFDLPSAVTVYANRGTSGIEGSLSTAVGYASLDDRLNILMIGDLSFFYDMNALINVSRTNKSNLRILLLNNGCGEIFHALPGLDLSDTDETFIAAKHQCTAKAWSQDQGFIYLQADSSESLQSALARFYDPSQKAGPMLLEVFTEPQADMHALSTFKDLDRAIFRGNV